MSTVSEIYRTLDQLFPFSLSMDFDNTGILVGDRSQPVTRALIALDCTLPVLELAKQLEAQLIITHHPVIFQPIRRVNEDSVVYHLIRSGIAVISAHTNLDIAHGGVNDALAEAVGLTDCRGLELVSPSSGDFLGRIGQLAEPVSAPEFALALKSQLGAASVKFADAGKPIQTIALCSGSGADYLELAAAAGADALLTSEVKQHQYLNAVALGISIFDAGHFDTEDIVIDPLREKLSSLIPYVTFLSTHLSPITAV